MADVYGAVRAINAAGVIRPISHTVPHDARAVFIDKTGGVTWSSPEAAWQFESTAPDGAKIRRGPEGEWVIEEGTLEIKADSLATVRAAGAALRLAGRAVLKHVAELGAEIRILDGIAAVDIQGRTIAMAALDSLRISSSNAASPGRLLPPPKVVAPPAVVVAPLHLAAEIDDDRTLAGAILVECAGQDRFWSQARRFLFRPGEPLILPDLPDGGILVRVSTVNRDGMAGPAGPVFKTTVMTAPPRWTGRRMEIHTGIIEGRLSPPVPNVPIRWDTLRTVTDGEGAFEFRPDRPFDITVGDMCVDAGGRETCMEDPVVFLSDPDGMTYLLPASGESHHALLYSRVPDLRLRNTSSMYGIRINGSPVRSADTWIRIVPAVPQTLQVDRVGDRRESPGYPSSGRVGGDPFEISILQDADGPRILNVALETRGPAERFYVLADVLDLGIGLRLPARAVFENDAGERFDVPLERVSEIRLEGRAAVEPPHKGRSRVWWVRVEAHDLLGNRSVFEKTVYHKRQKKFQSVGLKDLVRIWKNKL